MSRTNNRCYHPPSIVDGDWVVPNGNYSYPKWPRDDPRQVKEVVFDGENRTYTLKIWNPFKTNGAGYSHFNPDNFRVVSRPDHLESNMAKEPTTDRFFAIKLQYNPDDAAAAEPEKLPHVPLLGKAENGGFHLADVNPDHEEDVNHYDTTPLRESRTKVTNDVRDIIKHGERWVICEAIAFIDGEPPRPPIKLTELR